MTYKELIEQQIALQKECDEKKSVLRTKYAQEHNPVKVGDMVTDHYHTIRVENMTVYGHPVPFMRYTGIEMTKQGEPKKRQPIPCNPVYQNNVRIINGQAYKFEERMRLNLELADNGIILRNPDCDDQTGGTTPTTPTGDLEG